jgi:ribosomal-protein-alanine N-acetyltransferase
MVARPPLGLFIDRMGLGDLDAVEEIERQCFTTPWPPNAYRSELENNRLAHYLVARFDEQIVGFAGLWMMVDEAHITTFAVRQGWRRQGIGERLLLALFDLARARHAQMATLEVRPSNVAARRLYEKYGFALTGIRPRYYSDDNEDALIMTTPSIDSREMRELVARLRASVEERPQIALGADGLPIGRKAAEGAPSGEHAESLEAMESMEGIDGTQGGQAGAPDILRPSNVSRRS